MEMLAQLQFSINQLITVKTADQLWYDGFVAFMDGARLEDLADPHMQRGWRSALAAEAEATMPRSKN